MKPSNLIPVEVDDDDFPDDFNVDPDAVYFRLEGDLVNCEAEFFEGDLVSVRADIDAEAGELVVWWTGVERTMALARIDTSMNFHGVAGFAPPVPEQPSKIYGVVTGRYHGVKS